jgi:hypothetical protein
MLNSTSTLPSCLFLRAASGYLQTLLLGQDAISDALDRLLNHHISFSAGDFFDLFALEQNLVDSLLGRGHAGLMADIPVFFQSLLIEIEGRGGISSDAVNFCDVVERDGGGEIFPGLLIDRYGPVQNEKGFGISARSG